MAKQVLNNCGIYLSGYELSGYSNTIGLNIAKDLYDATTFGDGFRTRVPGLLDATFSCAGCWSPEEVDAVLQDRIGDIDEIVSLAAVNAVGGVSYFFRGVEGQYQMDAPINNVARWSMSGNASSSPIVRGKILHRATAAAATGNGAAQQIGAVISTQTIYAALHVFSVAGTTPSLTVKVQSDDASNFPSATDRLTFTAATDLTSEWKQASGAIADDYWRVNYTISGTNPVFGFVVSFGIL